MKWKIFNNPASLINPKRLHRAFALAVLIVMISGMTAYAESRDTSRDATDLGVGYKTSEKVDTETGALDTGISETGYRMKPLLDKLAAMDSITVEAYVSRFHDMDRHWSRQVVGKLTALGIIAGVGDGRFCPNNPVTAEQFIKMAVMAMGHKIEQDTGYWAQPFIDMAMEEGIIRYGEFADYKKPLSREEMARIIVRTALMAEEAPGSKYDTYIIGKIADYESINDSLKQYVLDGYKLGLIQGSNNRYYPKDTLTRAEAAAVIIRILDKTERRPTAPGTDEVIKLIDNLGNPMEIYPGPIREYFEIEKVMEKALPKAKGYATLFYNPYDGAVCVDMYRSYKAWQQDCVTNVIAAFQSNNTFNDPDYPFAYTFYVRQKEAYRELFADYIKEILKALYEKDAQKAIALHDKYLNIETDKPDGSNYWNTLRINNRHTEFVGDSRGFAFYVKLKGEK
ncbi:MAG: S-layer homology domain-containing protein [Bacillota bacterium]